MFAVLGVVGGLVLIAVAIYIFYVAGRRTRGQDQQDRQVAAKGMHQQTPRPPRATGRGDL